MTGCTFQRPQEVGNQAGAGIEKDPEAPGEGQGRGGLSGSQAFLPPGTVLTVVTCPTSGHTRVKSSARPRRLTLDLDHMFSDSCFNAFEILAKRPGFRWEEGRRVHGGRGKSVSEAGSRAQGLGLQSWSLHVLLKENSKMVCFRRTHLKGPFSEVPSGPWGGGWGAGEMDEFLRCPGSPKAFCLWDAPVQPAGPGVERASPSREAVLFSWLPSVGVWAWGLLQITKASCHRNHQ